MKEWLLTNKEEWEAEADGVIGAQAAGKGNPLPYIYAAIAKAQVKKIEQLKEKFCQEVKTIEQKRTSEYSDNERRAEMAELKKCPVCLGTGKVPYGFYGLSTMQTCTRTTETCQSCDGNGYI